MNILVKALDRPIRKLGYRKQTLKSDGGLRRVQLMQSLKIDTVLDVGANEGQYARYIRSKGYRGRLVSFEPLSRPYALLAALSAGDPDWHALQIAASDTDGTSEINVSVKDTWSSFMPRDDEATSDRLE